jgi:hypothetical protein
MTVVKVITASVYDADGNEALAPGTRVPYGTDLGPEVGYRLEDVADDAPEPEPAAEPEPEPEPPAAPIRKSATVSPEPAAGKGAAHK